MRGDTQARFLNATVGTGWRVDPFDDQAVVYQGLTGAYFTKRNESRYGKYYHILQKSTIENIVFCVSGCQL
jgi:hypothetical protein